MSVYEILKEYQIQPRYLEKIGKVYKVFSGNNVFALKETDVNKGKNLFSTFPFLYHKGFYRFVPFYPAKNGQYMISRDQKLYYLMPWLGSGERPVEANHAEKMIRELARLHLLTSQEMEMDPTYIEEHFERTSGQWNKEMKYLDSWIEQCEQKWYMSPFEWEFVQYYHEFRKAYEYALRTLNIWKDTILESKKIRTVLLHGKVSLDHFVFDDKGFGYFINFDESRIGSAYQDFLPFLSNTLNTYPTNGEDCIEWLKIYMKYYPLKETELLLMKSYFAHPGFMIRLLNRYQTRAAPNHEWKYTKKIQQAYWKLKNIENVVMRLEMGDQVQTES